MTKQIVALECRDATTGWYAVPKSARLLEVFDGAVSLGRDRYDADGANVRLKLRPCFTVRALIESARQVVPANQLP